MSDDGQKSEQSFDVNALEVYVTGDREQTDIRPSNNSKLPNVCLPAGVPPIWKGIEEQLLGHLENIEALPIHDYKSQQRHVDRKIDLTSLVKVSTLPPVYELTVQRDQKTGALVGFTEDMRIDPGSGAANSMSMLRPPDPESGLKGSTSNFPFWPGGLDLPSQESVELGQENLTEFRTIAPGLSRGLNINKTDTTPTQVTDVSVQRSLNITDLFGTDDWGIPSSDEEDETMLMSSPTLAAAADHDANQTEEEDVIEELTKDAKVITLTDMKTVVPEVKDTEFAIRLSVTDPISDFHQQVPDMAYKWPFELDIFQKQAVLCLENHENVFVAAHTSAGKTVVAEYAIALCSKHMTRAIYTSPIKALSNQKFRDFKLTFRDVGLITGDIQLNPEASCLIMTTEILRSMLYGGSDIIRDVEWVIFDEVHYINDAERGVVWEEVIIMLPDHVNIILLSATVPNHMDFADWVGRTKKRKVYVISTMKRPVPLEHYLYTGNSNKTSSELFLLVDSEGKLQEKGYRKAVLAKKERASSHSQATGPKGPRGGGGHGSDKPVWLSVIEMLRKKDKLPAVAFTFSKKRIEENASFLTSVDLTSSTEKSKIHVFIKKSIDRLKGTDKNLPQVLAMADLLGRGIGLHHSGVLPILKEIVELLFQQGLIKVLFATETFAMGVNMPARTVVFDSIRKHDGTGFRDLKPAEYIQMAGRAGRRGLDTTGTVIILCKGDVTELSDLNRMMLGKLTVLESRFRLTYTMMLNLLRVEKLRIQDMLKRSFSEFASRKDEGKHRDLLHSLRRKIKDLKPIDCFYCSQDLEQYYKTCQQYRELRSYLHNKTVGHPQCVKYMTCGRVVILQTQDQNALAVTLTTSTRGARTYKCLVLTEKTEKWWTESLKSSAEQVAPHKQSETSRGSSNAHIVLELDPSHIDTITTQSIKIPAPDKIVENYQKRLIPRFKDDPPSQSMLQLIAELSSLDISNVEEVNAVKEFNIRDIEMHDDFVRLDSLKFLLDTYICNQCSSFAEHFMEIRKDMVVRDEFEQLKFRLSDASLQLLPEYKERLKVLHELHYTDLHDTVQLKGKVACEIKQQELLITELIFENTMENLHYTEIAALLSCVVFEQKNASKPKLSPSLEKGVKMVKSVAEKLGQIQKKHIKDFVVADYVSEFKFGLVEVVYEWARGMPFIEILQLTDVQEGIIVRCIQRLDELIRDVKDAARIIGDPILGKKMEEASASIKRDIVFAASLYTS